MFEVIVSSGKDDGLCAQRSGTSYFLDTESEAQHDLEYWTHEGFEAEYRRVPERWRVREYRRVREY